MPGEARNTGTCRTLHVTSTRAGSGRRAETSAANHPLSGGPQAREGGMEGSPAAERPGAIGESTTLVAAHKARDLCSRGAGSRPRDPGSQDAGRTGNGTREPPGPPEPTAGTNREPGNSEQERERRTETPQRNEHETRRKRERRRTDRNERGPERRERTGAAQSARGSEKTVAPTSRPRQSTCAPKAVTPAVGGAHPGGPSERKYLQWP